MQNSFVFDKYLPSGFIFIDKDNNLVLSRSMKKAISHGYYQFWSGGIEIEPLAITYPKCSKIVGDHNCIYMLSIQGTVSMLIPKYNASLHIDTSTNVTSTNTTSTDTTLTELVDVTDMFFVSSPDVFGIVVLHAKLDNENKQSTDIITYLTQHMYDPDDPTPNYILKNVYSFDNIFKVFCSNDILVVQTMINAKGMGVFLDKNCKSVAFTLGYNRSKINKEYSEFLNGLEINDIFATQDVYVISTPTSLLSNDEYTIVKIGDRYKCIELSNTDRLLIWDDGRIEVLNPRITKPAFVQYSTNITPLTCPNITLNAIEHKEILMMLMDDGGYVILHYNNTLQFFDYTGEMPNSYIQSILDEVDRECYLLDRGGSNYI